jgi:hypothetical protein
MRLLTKILTDVLYTIDSNAKTPLMFQWDSSRLPSVGVCTSKGDMQISNRVLHVVSTAVIPYNPGDVVFFDKMINSIPVLMSDIHPSISDACTYLLDNKFTPSYMVGNEKTVKKLGKSAKKCKVSTEIFALKDMCVVTPDRATLGVFMVLGKTGKSENYVTYFVNNPTQTIRFVAC